MPKIDDVVSKTLLIADRSLSYIEMGSGPAVVIVHGVGGHKEDWIGVGTALAETHHVVLIDMLGFGGSSKNGEDLSMDIQAAAIRSMLDQLGISKVHLVGNSVGGWVTATFAASYPALVDRLILIDVAGFKAMFEGTPPVNFDPSTVEEQQALINITINSAVAQTAGLAQKALDAYVASGEKAIAATWGKSLYISTRLEELLPKISAKTLVMWGADDKLFPSVLASVFSGMIANSEVLLIPNTGHFPQIDNPEATTRAIANFLMQS